MLLIATSQWDLRMMGFVTRVMELNAGLEVDSDALLEDLSNSTPFGVGGSASKSNLKTDPVAPGLLTAVELDLDGDLMKLAVCKTALAWDMLPSSDTSSPIMRSSSSNGPAGAMALGILGAASS